MKTIITKLLHTLLSPFGGVGGGFFLLPLTALAQTFVPVGSRLDVESLNRHIDTTMDISELSLSDLRILRNAFAARQGYCFSDYALRAVFSRTSWYDSLLWERIDGALYDTPIRHTAEETVFIERLKKREDELRQLNFTCPEGQRVNTDNIVNKFQLEELSEPLYRRLARDGFAIVPRQGIQLFHCYENNDYHDFPNFITTDLHLQMLHTYFASMLQEVERGRMAGKIKVFADGMYDELQAEAVTVIDGKPAQALARATAWTEVLRRLTGSEARGVDGAFAQDVSDEVRRVMAAEDACSPLLGYTDVFFTYSMFRPRAGYSRDERMQRYFRSMMWLQTAPFCTADMEQMRSLVAMAGAIGRNGGLRQLLADIDGVLTLLVGRSDGLSLTDVADVMAAMGLGDMQLLTDDGALGRLAAELDAMSRSRMRIRPKVELSCREKICVMPQRYQYDSEVLQELVDVTTMPATRRGAPMGLDVMAAFGSQTANDILTREIGVTEQWPEYAGRMDSLRLLMPRLSSDTTVYNWWMRAVTDMQGTDNPQYPYFMRTPQWARKSLNAALASWTELKHDVLLYSKQPMAAECGGVIPDPVVVGYVEPNTVYWRRALEMVRLTASVLERSHFATKRTRSLTAQVEEQTAFLLSVSEKELAGKRLTEAEHRSIEKLGSTYEWLTLDILKDKATENGMVWEDVTGPDKSVSVVADVYTANASNNPAQGVLHEGVGTVDDIFVVVEINGLLHLTRGAVFSYREFMMPPGTRMTDEEWQRMLETSPRHGVPEWMDTITLPDPVPADNELIFYSSGC